MDKPLPEVPKGSPAPGVLSVDARRHLRAFLRHALKEEGIISEDGHKHDGDEEGKEEEGKSWVVELESALDELARCVEAGGWLKGFRRARALVRERVKAKEAKEAMADVEQSASTGSKGGEEKDASSEEDDKNDKHEASTTGGQPSDQLQRPSEGETVTQSSCSVSDKPRSSGATTPGQNMALQQLSTLSNKPHPPELNQHALHLLLTVSPAESVPAIVPIGESPDVTPVLYDCAFVLDTHAREGDGLLRGPVLFGVDEWSEQLQDLANAGGIHIVGGSFELHGFASTAQYDSLVRVLRLGTFFRLSLILEHSLLLDSHVRLTYPTPKPRLPPNLPVFTSPTPLSPPIPSPQSSSPGRRGRGSGIWSFLTKKRDDFLSRSPFHSPSPLRLSVDMPFPPSGPSPISPRSPPSGRLGEPPSPAQFRASTNSPRVRTFSFLSSLPLPKPSDSPAPTPPPPPPPLFTAALSALTRHSVLLSTSPGTAFLPPSLLTFLATAEGQSHGSIFKPTGAEHTALSALMGWEASCGKDAQSRERELVGMKGFVRHQGLCVLYSEHVPSASLSTPPKTEKEKEGSSGSASGSDEGGTLADQTARNVLPEIPAETDDLPLPSSSSSTSKQSVEANVNADVPTQWALCSTRRRWVSFRYYARTGGADRVLGEAVREWCRTAGDVCGRAGCKHLRGEHERRYIHAGVRVCMRVEGSGVEEGSQEANSDEVEVWERCKVCGKETERKAASDGTYLLSFAKLLELLIYSPTLCTLTPPLCSHTSPPSPPWPPEDAPLPRSRLNIIRCFGHRGRVVTLSLSVVEDIFDVRVPRLQILRSALPERLTPPKGGKMAEEAEKAADEAKKGLRKEIKEWWQAVAEHLDKLEELISGQDDLPRKSLPRLPSVDEAYSEDEDVQRTPRPNDPGLPDVSDSEHSDLNGDSKPKPADTRPAFKRLPTEKPLPGEKPLPAHSLELLEKLRHTFQRVEQELHAELTPTPAGTLNDVRRTFHSAARGAMKRLEAWQKKHNTGEAPSFNSITAAEPEWWKKGWHAVPGSHVIVREDDWGSIIAFTLSSGDYQKELAGFSSNRTPSAGASSVGVSSVGVSSAGTSSTATTPAAANQSGRRSYFPGPAKLFKSSAPAPDPDQDGLVWHEPDMVSAVISRKQHPRDPTYLLSLRDVLRNKQPADGSAVSASASLSQMLGGQHRLSGTPGTPTPPSAWAKPAVEVSTQAVPGEVIEPGDAAAGKVLAEIEAASPSHSNSTTFGSLFGGSSVPTSSSDFVQTHIRRAQAASLVSTSESESTAESEGRATAGESISGESASTVGPPPVDPAMLPPPVADAQKSNTATQEPVRPPSPDSAGDSYTATITNSLTSAMRYMLKAGDTFRPGVGPPPPPKSHHALLSADPGVPIDARPHVKYDFTVGKIRFSCTAYYARQFDALRRRCGVEEGFVRSMMHSANWTADGGKSRSNFWKTADERYIIKTLVNAWNVADLQVLLELAPAYFKYLDKTANRASVLAKVLGFYTVEVRNLETGATQAKADLLVMENLFYQQAIGKTFDLKGIQGRRVKQKDGESQNKTLFDGEWMEGQQHALTLVNPQSKIILEEAINHDCDFLAEANIMDYSLLLGIDQQRKEIVCGLVDTIGSYTFAKTLEYKAKQGLSGKDRQITVVPPREYEERFVGAMDGYFLACPDKWCRPLDGTTIESDPKSLPSVL